MNDQKTIRSDPALAWLLTALLRCGGHLPLAGLRTFGALVGGAGGISPNQPRAVTELNLRLCFPDLGADERRRLARRSLGETAKTFCELAAVWQWPPARLAALEEEAVGEELFARAAAAGRGTLLLAPHLGNWEFLNHFLVRRTPLVCLYRPPRVAELDGFLCRVRQRTGCVMAAATTGGMRPLLTALGAGHTVLILPDQEPLRAHGVHAPFFGVPALTMTLVSRLLRRTDAAALFVFARRRPRGRFQVRFLAPPEGLADGDRESAAAALNRGVEECVRLSPEQYLWSYKRFLSAPPGEPTPYRAIWSRRRLRRNPWPPPESTPG